MDAIEGATSTIHAFKIHVGTASRLQVLFGAFKWDGIHVINKVLEIAYTYGHNVRDTND